VKTVTTCPSCKLELEVRINRRDDVICPECGTIIVRRQRRSDTYAR
jgi:predicted RNA-binding Zn-ribbon protein involved in translation (DUF1610 family)